VGDAGALKLAVGLSCLALAVALELGGRERLIRELAREAEAMDIDAGTARHYAEAFLGRLLDEHLTEPSMNLPHIMVTQLDRERITSLLAHPHPVAEFDTQRLDEELARAEIVGSREVPPDVVTMNSRVRFADESSGLTREITLVYPQDADLSSARISVLSPMGSALLGLRVGQAIEWAFPRGGYKRVRVLAVPYQPEAAGHYHL
jgi:regulator of nucleoside diphosphate kinase